jgi:glycosyltransferase involved in cell wall biosynthesis
MSNLVSIILPVHNQEDHINQVVEELLVALKRLPDQHELILVPNACRDRSLDICNELSNRFENVRTHAIADRGGWGLAVRHGIEQASGNVICYSNSARTAPEVLLLALMYGAAYPEVVIKVNRKIRDGWQRRLGSLLFNLECRAFFDLPTWDINGTPKLFPRKFGHLLNLTRDDDLIDAEFNAICRRQGYPIIEIPILQNDRHGGKSTTTYKSAVRMYWGAFQLWQTMRQQGTV